MAEFIVLAFLAAALCAYLVAGGADFGAGILELFARGESRKRLRGAGEHALAPVWEANHIWIIVALVIVFVAFPKVHVLLTTKLHVPLVLLLVGIVLRGTAFTFRYYDVDRDPDSDRLWTGLFQAGSVLVPLLFGHIAAALSRGQLSVTPTAVWESYFAPWLGVFPLACGVFTVAICAWLAATFLVGEQPPAERGPWISLARTWAVVTVVAGGAVTLSAWWEGVPWFGGLAATPWALASTLFATLTLAATWRSLEADNPWPTRAFASATVAAILGGYFGAEYPVAVELADAPALTWTAAMAPEATVNAIALALCLGSVLILPGLVLLYRIFKSGPGA